MPLPGLDDPLPPPAAENETVDDFEADLTPKVEGDIDLSFPSAPAAPPPAGEPRANVGDESYAVTPKDAGGLDFDFAPPPKAEPASAPDMLDFVDEKPKPAAAPAGKRPPPPMISPQEPREEPFGGTAAGGDEGSAPQNDAGKQRAKPAKEARQRPKRGQSAAARALPKIALAIVAAAALVAVGVPGFRARNTTAGLFWMNRILPGRHGASAAEAQVIATGMKRLQDGDFAGARAALGSSARLLASLPDDEDVIAFYVLAASEAKLAYRQAGSDWDQARRVAEKMRSTQPAQERARGALALAQGDLAGAKQALAPLGEPTGTDLESIWLYSSALTAAGEAARAQAILDAALKARGAGSVKLLLLRGEVARSRGQLSEAASFYEKILASAPANATALVELADVRLRQGDAAKATELLAKVLETDARKSLDATEEARANALKARIAAQARQPKEAEAAFERAVALDSGSAGIRESYGNYRLQRREWDKAARQFDAAIAAGNGTPGVLMGAARAYLGTNRLLEADKRAGEAAAKDPADPRAMVLQGKVAEAIGKQDEAFKAYERALAKKPDSIEALSAIGLVSLSRGDKAKAKERLEAALKVPEASRSSLDEQAVGELAFALGDLTSARDAYTRALQKDPDDPMAHAGLGRALSAAGELPRARHELELALGQVDSDAQIQFEYGSLLRRVGEPQAAIAALQKAVKLDPKDARFHARLGAALVDTQRYEEAETELRQSVSLNDRSGEAQYWLARALAGKRALGEAIDVMKKAVELEGDNAEYLYQLGLIYEQSQRVQDAVDAFSRSLKLGPQGADAREHLGLSLLLENRFQEAEAEFRQAVALSPKRARLWALIGDAEQQAGDLEGAVRDYQRALAMDANLGGVWSKLGVAYKDLDCKGCRPKALDALKRAVHVDPADAMAQHELGYMYKDDGRRKDAIAAFRRYLELRPDAGDAPTVQDELFYLQEESRRAP